MNEKIKLEHDANQQHAEDVPAIRSSSSTDEEHAIGLESGAGHVAANNVFRETVEIDSFGEGKTERKA